MANGVKGHIKSVDVQHLSVAQYDSLSLERILEWTQQHYPHVLERMFPVRRELEKFPRQVSSLLLIVQAVREILSKFRVS